MRYSPTMYLTGVSTDDSKAASREDLGLLCTPKSGTHHDRHHHDWWAADNGCFSENKPGSESPFDVDRWAAWLQECGPDRCLFVTVPDWLNWIAAVDDDGAPVLDKKGRQVWIPVGDMVRTWERSQQYAPMVRAMGFPVAIVLQDGIENMPEVWAQILNEYDAVFVGGSDDFKLGDACKALIAEAKRRGLWVHVGRVNSWKRFRWCIDAGADSADGTFLKFGRKGENWPRLEGWLDRGAEYGWIELPVRPAA